MKTRTLNGWKFGIPTTPQEWMVDTKQCAQALTKWLEKTITLQVQGMPFSQAKNYWTQAIVEKVDGKRWSRDALDSEPRGVAYATFLRVAWILRRGDDRRALPGAWRGSTYPGKSRRLGSMTHTMMASTMEDEVFRQLNGLD